MVGSVVAGVLFGLYLYISSRCFNLNHNDAFSAMRLDSHRHFLRMRIAGDAVTLYSIALDRVPERHEWRRNDGTHGQPAPVYIPATPLAPHLVEPPVTVRGAHIAQSTLTFSRGPAET